MDKPSVQDIVRVKTLLVGDEFELIVPQGLADILDLNGKPAPMQEAPELQPHIVQQPGRIIPTPTPQMQTLRERAAERGIMAIEQAVPPEFCLQIVEYARKQNRHRSGLVNYDTEEKKMVGSFVDDKVRDTYNISVEAIKDHLLKDMFYKLVTMYVEPFFNAHVEWWELPQLLYYEKGGKYEPHVDADYWVNNPDGTAGWKRISDRDFSILLYLNDEFEGGELNFPDHNFLIKPKPGLLVAFPSGKEFRHGAAPTLSGERYVLVSWAAAEGVAKVQPQPPKHPVVFMKDLRKTA